MASKKKKRSKKAIVTIITNNYLEHAIILGDSIRKWEKETDFIIFVIGYDKEQSYYAKCGFEFIDAKILNPKEWLRFVFQYDGLAASCALKPLALKYALRCYEKVIYLDSDMKLFYSLEEAWKALDHADVSLTPHKNGAPAVFDTVIDPLLLRLSGSFNAGYIGVSSSAGYFLDWWWGKTHYNCLHDAYLMGIYLDQLYLNQAIGIINELHILKNCGYNVAWWNIDQKKITYNQDQCLVNGVPLVFFHYSCRQQILENFQRYYHENVYQEFYVNLYTQYEQELQFMKQFFVSKPYAYKNFKDGTPISYEWREFARKDMPQLKKMKDLFSLTCEQRKEMEELIGKVPEDFQPNKDREIIHWRTTFLAGTVSLHKTNVYIKTLEESLNAVNDSVKEFNTSRELAISLCSKIYGNGPQESSEKPLPYYHEKFL